MALLELATGEGLECSQLVVCLDRQGEPGAVADLTRDLGWVGFELLTLDEWADGSACTSDRWLFLGMET